MKKYPMNFVSSLALVLGFMLLTISGCSYAFDGIKGNGKVVKQERNVSGFSGIEVGGAFKVYITQGDEEKLVVEADENLLEVIETEVSGRTLEISTKEDIRDSKALNIYITFKSLDHLEISGACNLESENKLSFDNLELECSGASNIMLTLSAKEIEMDFSGASQLELFGSAEKVHLDLSGASKMDALEFEVTDLEADISGASHGKVMVIGTLSADVSGAASFKYKGDPKIGDIDVSGAASFKRY
ncbi:MAG: DUF2807 domain-containing protein [Bacteroidetes bacterium]|nr:DUF2807 domain-containing protein [Bacteroidota bacterium]